MPKEWGTADFHLWHQKIIAHCGRPFTTVDEMNKTIIRNYQEVVSPKDTVYILGDIAWKIFELEEILTNLPGRKHFIVGNHDRKILSKIRPYVESCQEFLITKIMGLRVTLCHYPLASWYRKGKGGWNLHGHNHGTLENIPGRYDVGVDCNNFYPVDLSTIIKPYKGEI